MEATDAEFRSDLQNTNATTMTGMVNATNAALLAWITAVEKALEIAVADHPETDAMPSAIQNSLVASLKRSYTTLTAALA